MKKLSWFFDPVLACGRCPGQDQDRRSVAARPASWRGDRWAKKGHRRLDKRIRASSSTSSPRRTGCCRDLEDLS
jgi:hypothetical protein